MNAADAMGASGGRIRVATRELDADREAARRVAWMDRLQAGREVQKQKPVLLSIFEQILYSGL